MDNNNKNNDWLDAVKDKAQNATRQVPDGTWDNISSALAQQAAVPKRAKLAPRIWKAVAAAAVVAIVTTTGIYINRLNNSDKNRQKPAKIAKIPQQQEVAPQSSDNTNADVTNTLPDEPLLAQNNGNNSGITTPTMPANYNKVPGKNRNYASTRQVNNDLDEFLDEELLANSDNELINLEDYPNEFNPENYYYDIETMLALEELYSQYDNAMNQEAMEPWKSYTDSTYQQYLVYDANARRLERDKQQQAQPQEKSSLIFAAYGNGLITGDRNSTITGSSAPMLAPPASGTSGMMLAPAAPGMMMAPDSTPNVAPPVNYDYHHHMPLTFGLNFTKRIVGNLYGNVGLNFTSMSSDVTPDNGGEKFKQNIKLIGLPFGVRWNFWKYKGLTTFVGGEGMVERVVDASFGKEDITIKRLQWSVHATAGLQYNFTKNVGIYIEPKLSHYITTMPLNTLRNEHPFNFNLQMGLSLDF